MGPIVDSAMQTLRLRPFKTSRTYVNLAGARCGVFHVTDDVLLLARAAVDRLTETPTTFPAVTVPGEVLSDACRWYEFQVEQIDDSHDRAELTARVVHV